MPGTDPNGNIAADQPIYQRDGNPRLVQIDARANPTDFGAGNGLNQVAGALDDVSGQIQEVAAKRDALWAQNISTKAEVDWQSNMAKAKQAFELDPSKGVNYAETFQQQYKDYQQSILDANPDVSGRAKDLAMTRMNSMGSTLFGTALNLQAKASTDWSIQTTQSTMNNISQSANGPGAYVALNSDGTPDTSWFDNARQKATETIATSKGIIPTAMSKDLLLKSNLEFDKAEIDTATNQYGAGQSAKWIADGHLGTSLTIPQKQAQVYELQRRQQEDTTQDIRDYAETAKGYSLQVQTTGQRDPLIEQQIAAKASKAFGTYGPAYADTAMRTVATDQDKHDAQVQIDQIQAQMDNKYPTKEDKDNFLKSIQDPNHEMTPQEENDSFYLNFLPHMREGANPLAVMDRVNEFKANFQQQVADSVKVNQARSTLPSMSLDELQQYKVTLGDNPTDNVGKSLSPIIAARVKAIQEDKFSVALGDDKQMQTMAAQIGPIWSGQSPVISNLLGGKDPTNTERANSVFQSVIARSLPIQQRLDPSSPPMVMPKSDADNIINQLKSAKSGTEISQIADSIKSRFGDYLPQALSQLHNNKDNPLPSGIGSVIGAAPKDAMDIASAISIPDGNGVGKEQEKEDNPGYTKLFKTAGKESDEKDIDSSLQTNQTLAQFTDASLATNNSSDALKLTNETKGTVGKLAKYYYLNPPPGQKYSTDEAVDAAVKTVVGQHVAFGSTNGVTYAINKEGKNGNYSDSDVANVQTQLGKELNGIISKYPSYVQGGTGITSDDLRDNSYWVTKGDMSGVQLMITPSNGDRTPKPVPDTFRSFEDMRIKGEQENNKINNLGTLDRVLVNTHLATVK